MEELCGLLWQPNIGLASNRSEETPHREKNEIFLRCFLTMLRKQTLICVAVSAYLLAEGRCDPLGFHLFLPVLTVMAFVTRRRPLQVSLTGPKISC
jgi:hypothetical protein